eukprot:c37436_g1_i1.p1 GENE.c37436_g1_i1~~c37436_g1_i1.p1  ORF type:complete len:185 (-),score=55.65 c37436_g1_i1:74-628(-)
MIRETNRKSWQFALVCGLVLFQFLVVTAALIFFKVLSESEEWPSTDCLVQETKIEEDCHLEGCAHHATVKVSFSPRGSSEIVVAEARKYGSEYYLQSESEASTFIEQFETGKIYTCWYNPYTLTTVKLTQESLPPAIVFCIKYFVFLGCLSVFCYIFVWDSKEQAEAERELSQFVKGYDIDDIV